MDPTALTTKYRVALVVLSAATLAAAFEPFCLWPLTWVGFAPLLVALRGASATMTRALAFLFGLVFYGATLHWLFRIFGPAAIALVAILAAATWAFGHLYWLAHRRLGPHWALAAAPVLWLGVDLFRSELWFFRFSWMQLGFSQVPAPSILQLVSVTGVYGLTLTIVAANTGLAYLTIKRPLHGVVAAIGIVVAAGLLGRIPVSEAPLGADAFVAGAIQTEASDLDTDIELTEECAEEGARLVVWPEYSLMEYPLADSSLLESIQGAARESSAYLIVGCKEHIDPADEERYWNSAVVVGPTGDVLGSYHKNYPVQFFRDGVPGGEYPVFDTELGALGIAICYDMDFAPVFRRLVVNGAELVCVPTYDSHEWGELQHAQHSAMARARAVEARRWVVRATSSGISQIIDPRANVRESLSVGESGVVTARVEAVRGLSLYCRVTYLLPYLCLALTVAFVLTEMGAWAWRQARARRGRT